MFKTLFTAIRKRIDDRRRYDRAIAEIESLTIRELIDMGADRTEMQRGVYRQIYG